MTLDQFWNIIEKVHRESGTDIDKRLEQLEPRLENFPSQRCSLLIRNLGTAWIAHTHGACGVLPT